MLGRGSLLAYLVHMTLRIVEIHRALKPTGSFYLHCDPTASHYLKLVLDAVFCGQGGDYINEITWKRADTVKGNTGQGMRCFDKNTDTILFYAKSDEARFNAQYQEYSEKYLKDFYKYVEADTGRQYRLISMTAPGDAAKGNPIYPVMGVERYWRYTKERMQAYIDAGMVVQTKPGNVPQRKLYLDEGKGVPVQSLWDDVPALHSQAAERLGYPTQKPEALLERIIKASSNEGDTVLDAYCGWGTTVAVAQRLGRRWIGIDITYQSIALIVKRLEDRYPDDWPAIEASIKLDGVPRDIESAMALANRKDDKTRKEFEKWAVLTFSKNQARINEKKGADGGIDGIAYFLIDKDTNGKAVFQVKSRPGTREDLAKLNSDRLREKAEFGFLICTGPLALGKAMLNEIQAAGKYKHPMLDRADDRLQVVMVAQLFAPHNHRLDLPMARADAVKSAAAKGDEDKQVALDL